LPVPPVNDYLPFRHGFRRHMKSRRILSTWGIPAIYAGVALAAALSFPRIEGRLFPGLVAQVSISAATAMYSAIASGTISLTAIVFSLAFVMVQFSATAYSPRLVLWIARDPLMSHSLGIFTATFIYALAALVGVDRGGSGKVPFISAWLVIILLIVSIGMFIGLIQRIGMLQVNRMLIFTGDRGREVIAALYPLSKTTVDTPAPGNFRKLPHTQTLLHHGRPRSIQAFDATTLVELADTSGGVIELLAAVGDTVVELTPLLRVYGAVRPLDERKLLHAIEIGDERTFEQDPKYAIRLLVDIAIKALSPAINDPTTAVQALDQIEDLLLRLGQRHLEMGTYNDSQGKLRLVAPFPTWEDLLRLSFDEICAYGATSVQVMRRMNALVADLTNAVPDQRRPALKHWGVRLKERVARSFPDIEERMDASKEDRQGLGVPRQDSLNNS